MNDEISGQLQSIADLDLEPIKVKLMDINGGPGWSLEKADIVEIDYKRFLTLILKYPNHRLMPSHEIDQFWHSHILDTSKYAYDCEHIFGYFLHHFPYTGMCGPEDKVKAAGYWADTKALFESEFGIRIDGQSDSNCSPDPSCDAPDPPGQSCDNHSHHNTMRPRPYRENSIVAI